MVNSEIIHHEMNEILKIKKKEVNKMRFDKERFFKKSGGNSRLLVAEMKARL